MLVISTTVRRDEAHRDGFGPNFLVQLTWTEKSEAFKPKNIVPTENQCGGSLMVLDSFLANASRYLAKNKGIKEQDQ